MAGAVSWLFSDPVTPLDPGPAGARNFTKAAILERISPGYERRGGSIGKPLRQDNPCTSAKRSSPPPTPSSARCRCRRSIDQRGEPKSALQVILEEAAGAGVDEFCVVVCPGDETAYAAACGALRPRVRFVAQQERARLRPRDPVRPRVRRRPAVSPPGRRPPVRGAGDDRAARASWSTSPSRKARRCRPCSPPARASSRPTAPSAASSSAATARSTRSTRCSRSPRPPRPSSGSSCPGLRAGFYLCFFGMHVLGPEVLALLDADARRRPGPPARPLARAARARPRATLPRPVDRRAAVTTSARRYGLLFAQFALVARRPRPRTAMLTQLVELARRPRRPTMTRASST